MLDLAGLAEQVDKLFPAPHLQRRLSGHRGLASIPSLLRSSSKCRVLQPHIEPPVTCATLNHPAPWPERWHTLAIEPPLPFPRTECPNRRGSHRRAA
jgi:hypothetical protein